MTARLLTTIFQLTIEFSEIAENIFTQPVPNIVSNFIIKFGPWFETAIFPIGSFDYELAQKLSSLLASLVGNMTLFEFFLIPGLVFFVVFTLIKWIVPLF